MKVEFIKFLFAAFAVAIVGYAVAAHSRQHRDPLGSVQAIPTAATVSSCSQSAGVYNNIQYYGISLVGKAYSNYTSVDMLPSSLQPGTNAGYKVTLPCGQSQSNDYIVVTASSNSGIICTFTFTSTGNGQAQIKPTKSCQVSPGGDLQVQVTS